MHKRFYAILPSDSRVGRIILLNELLVPENLSCLYGPYSIQHLLLDSPNLPVLGALKPSARRVYDWVGILRVDLDKALDRDFARLENEDLIARISDVINHYSL